MASVGRKRSAREVLATFSVNAEEKDPPEYSVHESMSPQNQAQVQHANDKDLKAFNDLRASDLSYKYHMGHKYRGCFIILNHERFKKGLNLDDREGTEEDCIRLENTAKILGFDEKMIRRFNDLHEKEIVELLNQVSGSDHSDCDCIVIAVLTHGKTGDLLYAKDCDYHMSLLTRPFLANNCRTLAGKPKLFFIQACRGRNLITGHNLQNLEDDDDTVDAGPLKPPSQKAVIPNSADFLLAFSTIPECFSWRNCRKGSWFIQSLCKGLDEFGHELELMNILTRVNRIVAYEYESNCKKNPKQHKKKQIPSIDSRLTCELHFFNQKRTTNQSTQTRLPFRETSV